MVRTCAGRRGASAWGGAMGRSVLHSTRPFRASLFRTREWPSGGATTRPVVRIIVSPCLSMSLAGQDDSEKASRWLLFAGAVATLVGIGGCFAHDHCPTVGQLRYHQINDELKRAAV